MLVVVLGRLEGPGASSSEEGSGAARFLPFVSLTGSLMVRAVEVAGAVRRDLGESALAQSLSGSKTALTA